MNHSELDKLKARLKPQEAVAYHAQTGRLSIFRFGVARVRKAISPFGWQIVAEYTPNLIHGVVRPAQVPPAAVAPEQLEPQTSPAGKRRGPKPKKERA